MQRKFSSTQNLLPFGLCSNISIFYIPSSLVEEYQKVEKTSSQHLNTMIASEISNVHGPTLQKSVSVMNGLHLLSTDIHLASTDNWVPVLPKTFLDGSAPHLQVFGLLDIPFLMLHNSKTE